MEYTRQLFNRINYRKSTDGNEGIRPFQYDETYMVLSSLLLTIRVLKTQYYSGTTRTNFLINVLNALIFYNAGDKTNDSGIFDEIENPDIRLDSNIKPDQLSYIKMYTEIIHDVLYKLYELGYPPESVLPTVPTGTPPVQSVNMSDIININIFNMIKWYKNNHYPNLNRVFFGVYNVNKVYIPTGNQDESLYNLLYDIPNVLIIPARINNAITDIITTINDKMKTYVTENNNLKSIDVPNENLKLEKYFNVINDSNQPRTDVIDIEPFKKHFIYNTEIFNDNTKTGANSLFHDNILYVKINVDAMNHYMSVPSNLSIKLSADYQKLLVIDGIIENEFIDDYRLTYEIQYLIYVVPQYDNIKPAVLRFMRKINKLFLRLFLNDVGKLETEWYTDDKYDDSKIFEKLFLRLSHSSGKESLTASLSS